MKMYSTKDTDNIAALSASVVICAVPSISAPLPVYWVGGGVGGEETGPPSPVRCGGGLHSPRRQGTLSTQSVWVPGGGRLS